MIPMQRFEDAVGLKWSEIKTEHPAQAADIENQFGAGEILVAINAELAKDADYLALVAKTDSEVDIAGIIKIVGPFVISAIGKLTGIAL